MDSLILRSLKILSPKPNPFELIRIGGNRDGAYLIPNCLDGITDCFSPGVNNFKRFEDELVVKYKIKSHLCDKSSDLDLFQTPIIKNWQTFQKKWLASSLKEDSITLEEWVEKYACNSHELILQMDIEGAEYDVLNQISEDLLKRFRIIIIEFHNLHEILLKSKFSKDIYLLLKSLSKNHTSVHLHPNNCDEAINVPNFNINLPNVLEITFLRNDFMKAAQKNEFVIVPNNNDIVSNVVFKKPIFLNKNWKKLNPKKIKINKKKIIKDWLFYLIIITIVFLPMSFYKMLPNKPILLRKISSFIRNFQF